MTAVPFAIASLLARLVYPARVPVGETQVGEEEVEAWVEAAGDDYFVAMDQSFVDRARGLGVDSGMVLDLGSRLGLVPMKILWEEEGLLCMGVYRSLAIAERARETAQEWNLGERMFFQVGEPGQIKFKTDYFDMVVSDGALHHFEDPIGVLREIDRVTKPSGAILIRNLLRPNRLRLTPHITEHGSHYRGKLEGHFATAVRAGFTIAEMGALVTRAGIDRVRVVGDDVHVILERRGANDPSSWVSEREKYR